MRATPVELLVDAQDAEEAIDKAHDGAIDGQRDLQVIGDLVERTITSTAENAISTVEAVASQNIETDITDRFKAAVAIVASGVELLDRVVSASLVANNPGKIRIITETGSFVCSIALENFKCDPEVD